MSDDSLPTLKILLIGPSGAGKSALLTRYCDDEFDPDTATATIGIDFKIKKLSVRGKAYRLTLFDTAGQERFRTLSTSFYRGAHGVILVYDVSSRASFRTMERWFEEAENNTVEDAVLYLVGAKLDKAEHNGGGREVSPEEGRRLAKAHGAMFCEASSKTRENVRKPFVELVDAIVSKPELLVGNRVRRRAAGTVDMHDDGAAGYLPSCAC
ncbi:P-loop containing nucleoside triphosphate hydrolase protein [Diplogelasinospora grovesii]|uniref:P-loop containing nucleoside triphosphate hydrolase protein n=1 Tax=Diplogelasinospora grovesii TaxID=303347 RepID=A0AAN6NFV6_9PEZI|nr:P-loop containing nucleoside triphosphate hydrolase protein [Diplogelasinospora grovesii]